VGHKKIKTKAISITQYKLSNHQCMSFLAALSDF